MKTGAIRNSVLSRGIFAIAIAFLLNTANLCAQPQKTRVQTTRNRTEQQKKEQATSRAALMFPTAVAVPEEVMWRRDIYRQLDLMQDQNAALYYPMKPQGDQQNLFTVMFRLFSTGRLPVYEPNQSGVEDFSAENRMHFKTFVDKWSVPYEMEGNRYKIEDIDIPSDEVKGFYVKESSYYDQNTATYHTRVTALCPLLYRSDDYFSMDERQWPLFWVKMEDIEPYLSQHMVMTSNVNNAATMSMADFFATNHYKGKIFMTTNMQGKSLQQQVADRQRAEADTLAIDVDPATAKQNALLKQEQNLIERQMADFEKHIWTAPVDSAALAQQDSINAAAKSKKTARAKTDNTTTARSARRSSSSEAKPKKEKSSSSGSSGGGSSAPRVTVRRQRH